MTQETRGNGERANETPAQPRRQRSTLFGISAGNAVEWFDWAIYATFASFISTQLFSKEDPASSFLATLAVFAVGFAARPIGALLFGALGDRVGRKSALTLAVAFASVGSFLIAIAPTFDSVGVWASVVLVTARVIQGLAHGGELPAAQTYIAEIAPAQKRGIYSSLIYVSGTSGIVLGTLLGAILAFALEPDQMDAWGWRIPFFIGGALGLYTLIMRLRLRETKQFTDTQSLTVPHERPPLLLEVWRSRRQALKVIGLNVGLTVCYYIWSVSTPAYAIAQLGMDPASALWVGVAANVCFIAILPLWGWVSDRIGRKPVLLIACIGAAVLQFPMTWLVRGETWQLFVAMVSMLLFIGAAASILPAVFAEMFPTGIRTTGVAVPYAIAVAMFGGTAAFLQAGFNRWFGEWGATAFSCYAVLLLLVSAITVTRIAETRGKVLH